MKFLGIFFALVIGYSNSAYANHDGFKSQYVKPITIKIFSSKGGVIKEEHFFCTPQTCCFSERFYCFMENGKCICDLHICEQWPNKLDTKNYWMEITGTEAERHCGRPRLLHKLTNLCRCDPDKNPPCDECNPPVTGCCANSGEGVSLPLDCRP